MTLTFIIERHQSNTRTPYRRLISPGSSFPEPAEVFALSRKGAR